MSGFFIGSSQSKHAGQFTVKGAMMFLVWAGEQYRPTIDLDLTALRDHSGNELKAIFQGICSLAVEDDGLVFLSIPVRVEAIRADTEYGGMRVALEARLGQARIPLQVDIGFGDAITPKARIEEFPALLDFPAPHLPMYIRFKRFAAFMRDVKPAAVYLYEVTPANASAFVANIQAQLARSTVRSTVKLMNKAFARFLPVGGAQIRLLPL